MEDKTNYRPSIQSAQFFAIVHIGRVTSVIHSRNKDKSRKKKKSQVEPDWIKCFKRENINENLSR